MDCHHCSTWAGESSVRKRAVDSERGRTTCPKQGCPHWGWSQEGSKQQWDDLPVREAAQKKLKLCGETDLNWNPNFFCLFSCSVTSDSLQPHGLQHTRLPCPSLYPQFAQTHVHWIGGALLKSHPLSPPSPFAFNLSQHQGLFQWVGSNQVAKVLELQLQSFQWIFRVDFL